MAELTIDQVLQKAIEAHQAGQVQDADRLYTAILKVQPRHPDANHNLGVLAIGVGKVQEALPFLKIAVEVSPNILQFWLSYIDALIKLGHASDARTLLALAKSKGAKGNVFDQLKIRLSETKATVNGKTGHEKETEPVSILDSLKLDEALNLAKKKGKKGIIKEARSIYQDILARFPRNHRAISGLKALETSRSENVSDTNDVPKDRLQSLINLYNQGQFNRALKQSKLLVAKFPKSAALFNIQGALLQALGQHNQSIEAFNKAIAIKPDYSEAYNNMGNALQGQGKLREAIETFNKSIAIKPDYAEAYNNMGNALQGLGKQAEAIETFNKALFIKPDYAEAFYNMGNSLQGQGKLKEAIKTFNKAIDIKPDYSEAYNNMGNALQQQQKLEESIEAYNRALSIKPDNAEAYNNIGNAFKELGKLEEAIKAFTKSIAIKPDYSEAYSNMGSVFQKKGKLEEAIEVYNKALSIKPDNAEAYNNMGNAFKELGKLEEAIKAFTKSIAIKPDYSSANRHLSLLIKYTPSNPQINFVNNLLNSRNLNDSDRCHLHYTFAKMKEDLGDLKDAFDSYVAAGKLRKKLLAYNFAQDQDLFSKIRITAPQLKKVELNLSSEVIELKPIFILGMPRSGTTLVEQIVSSHPKVTGAGELAYISRFGSELALGVKEPTRKAVSIFRKRYLLELSKQANARSIVTDKMPRNFLYIPLICAAFPEAKIVHVQRNAEATCWSNFKHYFASKDLGYSYNLADTVRYYKLYEQLMQYWYESFEHRIYSLDYDTLTERQEPETRRLIKYLGLNWENICLAPQKNMRPVSTASQIQVRKKIYTGSSKAWRKYESFLNDAFKNLKYNPRQSNI